MRGVVSHFPDDLIHKLLVNPIDGIQPGGAGGGYYNATIADGRSLKGSIKFSF